MVFELIQGPPRSGKKSYLKTKLKNFLKRNISTENILILTNSVKSAENFKECAKNILNSYSELWIESGTSFCKKVLRENYFYTDLNPGFKIITDFEKRLIVRTLLKRNLNLRFFKTAGNKEGLVREISNFIDIAKRNPNWTEKIKDAKGSQKQKYLELKKILQLYQRELKKLNYADFVDLHLSTRKMIKNHPDLFQFKIIISYETEDMDLIMGDIISRIGENAEHAFISLSPLISVYSFRGARPYKLKQKLTQKFDFEIKTMKQKLSKSGLEKKFIEASTRDEQAKKVAADIAIKLKKKEVTPSDIIIIGRSVGENMELFTQALKSQGINSVTLGGIGFFRQPEVIEMMSILAYIDGKEDLQGIKLRRMLKISGIIEDKKIDKLQNKAILKSKSLITVMEENYPEKFREFNLYMDNLRRESKNKDALEFIYYIMEKFGFLKRAANNKFGAELYGYFYKIVEDYSQHYESLEGKKLTFKLLMDNFYELLSGFGKDLNIPHVPDIEAVKIMTVQQAKNLECKIVYLIDMVEDTFPRPFFENPLLKVKDYKVLNIKPVFNVEQRYKFEKRLYKIAQSRASSEVIYTWYNFENSGNVKNRSEFLEKEQLQPVSHGESEFIINDSDLISKIAEDGITKKAEDVVSEDEDVSEKFNLLRQVKNYKYERLFNRVKDNLPDIFSYTLLESYVKCPRILFYRYVVGLNEPDSIYKSFGIVAHGVFQKLYEAGIDNKKEALNKLKDIWGGFEFYSEFESRNLYKKTLNIVEEYFTGPGAENFKVKNTEKKFYTEVENIKLRGRVDREDKLPSGKTRTVDYKTGKRVPGKRGLLNAVERGENFQIPIYKWAVNSQYFTVLRLRKKAEKMEVNIDFTQERASRISHKARETLKSTVAEIKKGNFQEAPSKSSKCRFCYYRRLCKR
ncbi:MAG: PD-(D/E)XK nuclease family protein [Elusimicrobiota bacterium]